MSQYRAEAARLRLLRANPELITPVVVEALKAVTPEQIAQPEKATPLAQEILKELRRLATAMEKPQPAQATPIVNVTPSIASPAVNVTPHVEVTAPTRWHVSVKHHTFGLLQGKIESVEFIAIQP